MQEIKELSANISSKCTPLLIPGKANCSDSSGRFWLLILMILMATHGAYSQTPRSIALNPYQGVDWHAYNQYKSNLHTHTTWSDGAFHPHEVVDLYYNAGYHILSITDHNLITWPWTGFSLLDSSYHDRDPQLLGMLAVMGNELSASHHTGSYVNAVPGSGAVFTSALDSMTLMEGLGILFHPGSYWSIDSSYAPNDVYSPDWYMNLFNDYPVLTGLEVYNQGNRHPYDVVLWDELLIRMMPHRPVWGYSNDDMHVASQLFRNYNILVMPSLDLNELKHSMETGAMYFVWEPDGDGTPLAPVIDSIVVDVPGREIRLHGKYYTSVEWISGIDGVGSGRTPAIVDTGSTFSYNGFPGSYVRAVLINDMGRTYTQPFGFDTIPPSAPDTILGMKEICFGTDTASFSVAPDPLTEWFHWELPNGAVVTSGLGTHHITVDLSGVSQSGLIQCWKSNASGNSDTLSGWIVVHPIPDQPMVTRFDSLLVSSAFTGNQWYDQHGAIYGATENTFTPGANGSYYVIVTLNGCVSLPSDTTLINTGIHELSHADWRIWPIPANQTLLLKSPSQNIGKYQLSIIHIDGRVLLQQEITPTGSGATEINISGVPEGVHLLRITNSNNSLVKRVLILR